MVLTPFSRVLIRLFVALIVLQLGWILLREAMVTWSPTMWVGVSFALLRL